MEKTNKILTFNTYQSIIKNSVGSKIFKNLYMSVDGVKTDITENGNLSCAFYVSSILLITKLIKSPHATVDGTVRDMLENDWVEINEPKTGCVLVWEKTDFGGGHMHKHIGFFVGGETAISNNSKTGEICEHHFTFDSTRKIKKILWNSALEN